MTSLSTLVLINQADKKTFRSNEAIEDHCDEEKYRLSLAYERLHTMPKLLLHELSSYIKILDISHNEFEDLKFLREFRNLTTLICDHNNIISSTTIPFMPQLDLLWMNHCKIAELYPWAIKLQQSCPNLRYLSLMGNPAAPSYLNGRSFQEHLPYRLFMISLFPLLIYLDDGPVTDGQRTKANHLYKRPFLGIIGSKSAFSVPSYIRSVSNKVSEILAPLPPFMVSEKNMII